MPTARFRLMNDTRTNITAAESPSGLFCHRWPPGDSHSGAAGTAVRSGTRAARRPGAAGRRAGGRSACPGIATESSAFRHPVWQLPAGQPTQSMMVGRCRALVHAAHPSLSWPTRFSPGQPLWRTVTRQLGEVNSRRPPYSAVALLPSVLTAGDRTLCRQGGVHQADQGQGLSLPGGRPSRSMACW